MKERVRRILLLTLSALAVYSFAVIKAAEAHVGVSATFVNPIDEIAGVSDLWLAQAPNSTSQGQQGTNQGQGQSSQGSTKGTPAYYVYSSRYDVALGYKPERFVVENLGGEFEISTWEEFNKYKIVPVSGRNLEQALSMVNLKEFKVKDPDKLVNVTLRWVKSRVYKKEAKFQKLKKEGDIYVLPFTYKDLDYSALWKAYTRKAKKVKLNNYYVDRKGAVYLFVEDGTLIAVYAFKISDLQKELDIVRGFRANLFVSPQFVKDMEYRLYGTDIYFTLNQRYWIVMPNKNFLYMEFYHSKYETQPEYAALYSSTAIVSVFPEKAYKEVTEASLREQAISLGISDIRVASPKIEEKEARQKAEAKVSKISTKKLTFYCYTSPEKEISWGGYKPDGSSKKPKVYKRLCVAGRGKTVLVIRATIVKGSEGEKSFDSILQSFYIEDSGQVATSPTPNTPTSWLLDGRLHIVPVAKAASGAAAPDIEPLEAGDLLGPLGTVKLFNLNCINFRVPVNRTTQATRLANKVYTLCGAGTGSGFAVDSAHIVSNAHVMSPPPFMTLVNVYYAAVKAISAGKVLHRAIDHGLTKDMVSLATAAVTYYQNQGTRFSSYNDAVKGLALQLLKETVTTATKNDVQRASNDVWATVGKNGSFAIQGDSLVLKNSAQMSKVQVLKDYDITANLLVSMLGSRAVSQGLSLKPDLALGKAATKLKVVPLPIREESSYSPGTRITVIGYPGLIETSNLLSPKSTYPTVTKGTISGIKDAAGAKFKIVQISAAVAHGNSGGPVVDPEGKVLGVLTYSFSAGSQDSADLAGAVDIQEARAMLDSQHVSYNKSALTAKVLEAVREYNKSRFKNAKRILEDVKRQNPTYFSYTLDPILTKLQLYIDKGLDKSTIQFSPEVFGKYLLPVAGGIVALGLIVSLGKVFAGKKRMSSKSVGNAGTSAINNALPQVGMASTPSTEGQQATHSSGTPAVLGQQPQTAGLGSNWGTSMQGGNVSNYSGQQSAGASGVNTMGAQGTVNQASGNYGTLSQGAMSDSAMVSGSVAPTNTSQTTGFGMPQSYGATGTSSPGQYSSNAPMGGGYNNNIGNGQPTGGLESTPDGQTATGFGFPPVS